MKLRHLIASPFLALTTLSAQPTDGPKSAPVDLRCDGLVNPIAASAEPMLSWQIASEKRGTEIAAAEVRVAASAAALESTESSLWNSGKIDASGLPGVAYAGPSQKVGSTYHWQVRWWRAESEAPSPWSQPATFEIAPTSSADWQGAAWMDDGKDNPSDEADLYENDPAPLMRREFAIAKPITRARLHVAGIGLCLPSLNGSPLTDHVFDPPWTNFDKRILYRTHDVTDQLEQGENCLGIELGNGWFNPLPLRMWGHRNIRGSLPVGRPRAIALLVIDHPDGTSTTVTSGETWTTTEGPTLRNSIYLGEHRDARLDPEGWNTADFDASAWKPVNLVEAPLEPLQPLDMEPARLKQAITAKSVNTLSPGLHIVDFGVNFTGIPEIKIDAPAGTEIKFRFGELLHDDGALNPMSSVAGQIKGMKKGPEGTEIPIGGPGAPAFAWQNDSYIAKGGGETFRPKFTYHGFRYMEISGLEKPPETSAMRAFPLHTDLPSVGKFSSSDELLNQIQEITRRTFLANVVTVQSDCPHRERFGYGGDIVATSEAYLMNYDMAGFYAKTVRDWAEAAREDGNFTDTAPFVGIQYCGVGWAMVHPLLLEQLYQHYGDKRLIVEQLPAAMRWFELEASKREKGGLVMKGLGDHEALTRIAGPVITTPMFIDTANRMARLCRIVGKDEAADRFAKMAAESVRAWTENFFDEATGKVGGGSQSEQVLALQWDALLEESAQKKAFDFLLADVAKDKANPSLTTGIFGTRALLEELSKRGRTDLAYGLATRKTFPSWGWMLENGATTLWEDWQGTDGGKSHNHPMFGSVSEWFFRWLGGIQCAPDAVGFDHAMIRPQIVGELTWVKSSHDSARGTITSNWSVSGKERSFEIVIPTGVKATVELPIENGQTLTENGKALEEFAEIKLLESTPTLRRLELGSGTYRFTAKP